MGSAVVRALSFHCCGPGSITAQVICELEFVL